MAFDLHLWACSGLEMDQLRCARKRSSRNKTRRGTLHQQQQKLYLIFDNVMTASRGHIASGIYDFNLRFLQPAETLNLLTWIALINLGANYLKKRFCVCFAVFVSLQLFCLPLLMCFFFMCWSKLRKKTKAKEKITTLVDWLVIYQLQMDFEHRNVIRLTVLRFFFLRVRPGLCLKAMSHLAARTTSSTTQKANEFDTFCLPWINFKGVLCAVMCTLSAR